VGALTDRDFRFAVRVWYLDSTASICPGCARGCNIEVHVNRRRPHHNEGRRVARLKPRFNADVNRWWICDDGRYGFTFVDDKTRLVAPSSREDGAVSDATWEEAIAAIVGALGRFAPAEIGVFASPKMANEDLWALRRVLEQCGIRRVAFRVPPPVPGDEDTLLIRSDKNPNSRGAELLGLDGDGAAILRAACVRQVKCLWVFGHDLLASAWDPAETDAALRALSLLIFIGTNSNATSERAQWVLPAAAWVEREGTYTNFEGRVQRFRQAVEPLGQALPEWDILGRVLQALGAEVGAPRAERWFRELTSGVPAFGGMSYQAIGDTGAVLNAPSAGQPRSEPASRTPLR